MTDILLINKISKSHFFQIVRYHAQKIFFQIFKSRNAESNSNKIRIKTRLQNAIHYQQHRQWK